MLLLSMQLSHTRPTKTDTSVHSRSLIQASMLRVKRELEIPAIMLLSFFTLRDLRIYPSSTDWEMLSEFTEPLSDFTTTKDNSMPTSFTTAHGLSSQLTRSQLSKKSEVKNQPAILLPSLTLESTSLSKRTKVHLFKTLESGLNNTSLNTTLLITICLLP